MQIEINPPISDVMQFCEDCASLNYNNNRSLQAMKYNWCIEQGGAWWAAYSEGRIVSMAGAHPFWDGFRFLFRGAQTQYAQTSLSKKHLTSIPWAMIMPHQIAWTSGVLTEETPAFITTNISHDESGKMNRTHRVLQLLQRQNIVDYYGDHEIYHTMQSVWKLNVGAYYETLA